MSMTPMDGVIACGRVALLVSLAVSAAWLAAARSAGLVADIGHVSAMSNAEAAKARTLYPDR